MLLVSSMMVLFVWVGRLLHFDLIVIMFVDVLLIVVYLLVLATWLFWLVWGF